MFITVFVGLLPLAVLAFVGSWLSAQEQKEGLITASQGTMRAIVAAVDAELAASVASLDALAASPRLASNDFAGFHLEARELLSRRPTWLNVVLTDPRAQQEVNAYLAWGTPLGQSSYRPAIETVVRTGKTAIGQIVFSPTVQQFVFTAHVPVYQQKRLAHVLTAVVTPESVQQMLRLQPVPVDGVVAVFDTNYNVVARTMQDERFVGRPGSEGLRRLLEEGRDSGWDITATLEGVQVYTVYYRSPVSGWSAAIGIPVAAVDAPIRRSYLLLGGLILGSVALGILGALLVSRAISRPMHQLKAAAIAMGSGKRPEPPDSKLPEIRDVAAALTAAHTQREALLEVERRSRQIEHDARVAAERASKLKDEFLAMLGHELRNPLAAISSASILLEASIGKPGRQGAAESATAIIQRQSTHLARLTDDLLDAGRVVLGRIQLVREPTNLATVVQNALDTLRNTHRLAGYEVTSELTPVWVHADPTRIDQIVSNLLTNAIKYTPHGGHIDVRVESVGDEAVFRVRDSGIGIEPELQPRIFELFVQGPRAPDRSQGGLGIGLTLVRRLTELHDGSVEVTSAGPGLGSEFVVRLPAIDAPARLHGQAISTVDETNSLRIAIVEDNEDVRASLQHMLEIAGHEVFVAEDGESGLQLVVANLPHIALIDIGLPRLDGLALARELRARRETRFVRLIAMSGYGNAEHVQAGLAAGFDNYLVKPVDAEKLNAILRGTGVGRPPPAMPRSPPLSPAS